MGKNKLRIIFFGEPASTFSLLHYEAIRKQADVVLWVSSQHGAGTNVEPREKFLSARDWWQRFQVRASLEWQTLRQLGKPVVAMRSPRCPARVMGKSDENLAGELAKLDPDAFISAGFRRILPPSVLAVPGIGAFNCHPSLLPRYGGSNPWFWILRAGESESGVTIHRMAAEADAGPIVRQNRFPVPVDWNHQRLYNYSSLQSAHLLQECVRSWTGGIVEERRQDLAGRSFFSAPKHKDYQIDWTKTAREIENLVRASSPSPGAWTTLGGRQCTVRETTQLSGPGSSPGRIVQVNENRLGVSCADGVVVIQSISLEGREIRGAMIARTLQASTYARHNAGAP